MIKYHHRQLLSALLLFSIAALTGLSGCRMGPNDNSQYKDIEPEGWNYSDSLIYFLEPRDSVVKGDLTLSLRHTNDYIYSNIYLEVTISDSLTMRRDTLGITLADDFGRWKGRGIGTDYQMSQTVARDLSLHRPVTVSVRHIMRDEVLKDVEQVGISFVE